MIIEINSIGTIRNTIESKKIRGGKRYITDNC